MKKLLTLFVLFAFASAADLDLNELCSEILFESLPHPRDQSLFIGCVQGKGTLLSCSKEGEVFDPILVACVTNDFPVSPPQEELCAEAGFGWFAHDSDCELYIVCEFSRTHIRRCPANSIFNPDLPGCQPGNPETCELGEQTTDTPTPPTPPVTDSPTEPPSTDPPTTISTTTRNPGSITVTFVCPFNRNINIPHDLNCSRYFECFNGVRTLRTCPNGQIFNIVTSSCGDEETSLCADVIQCA